MTKEPNHQEKKSIPNGENGSQLKPLPDLKKARSGARPEEAQGAEAQAAQKKNRGKDAGAAPQPKPEAPLVEKQQAAAAAANGPDDKPKPEKKAAPEKPKTRAAKQDAPEAGTFKKKSRMAKREEDEHDGKKKKRERARLIPIWLRLILLIVLSAIAALVGAMIGYGVLGNGDAMKVFDPDTWKHIYNIIYKGTK